MIQFTFSAFFTNLNTGTPIALQIFLVRACQGDASYFFGIAIHTKSLVN